MIETTSRPHVAQRAGGILVKIEEMGVVAWATKMISKFQPLQSSRYTDGKWTDGLTRAHLIQVSPYAKDGYSMVSFNDLLAMVAIQLRSGVLTDPANAGIDALAIRPTRCDLATRKLGEDLLGSAAGIGSIAFVKGRKRSAAALVLAQCIMDEDYDVAEKWPTLWTSMRELHATVQGPFDEKENFLKSMRISVQSSITRTRPHIFVWVHNFRQFGTDEQTTSSMLAQFDKDARGGLQAKLSKKERSVSRKCG